MTQAIHQLYSRDYPSFTELNRLVRSRLPASLAGREYLNRTYLDTFDWRLYKAGFLLEADRQENNYLLRLRSIKPDSSFIEQHSLHIPVFHWETAGDRLRTCLKRLIKERALIELGMLDINSRHYEIRDDIGKIVTRIRIDGAFPHASNAHGNTITAWLEIRTLRGYGDEANSIRTVLSRKHNFSYGDTGLILSLFDALGKTPGNYSSKPITELEHDTPSHAALAAVLLENLDIMERNKAGIRQDIDIEFLHDFRVANRRSRTLVTRVKNVFPKDILAQYRQSFSWLSKLTSTHRDLDVFLADFAVYESRIPANGGRPLEPLYELLHRNRNVEHDNLLKALNSQRFNRFMRDWRNFLEKGKQEPLQTKNATAPIIDVASKAVWKNYCKLLQQGEGIKNTYSFEAIHKLRKDGKKLRYLLEAFSSLYPTEDMGKVIKNLKKLQNNLGDIVDMHTQRFMLEEWKQVILKNSAIHDNTITAIEYLESLCIDEERKAGEKFRKRFSRFSSKSTRELFHDLFS